MIGEFFEKVKLDVEKEKLFKKSKIQKIKFKNENNLSQTQQFLPYKSLMFGNNRITLIFDYSKNCYMSEDQQYTFTNNILSVNGSEVYGPIKLLLISDNIQSYCIYQKRNLIVNKKSKPAKTETDHKSKTSTWIIDNNITKLDGPAMEIIISKNFYIPDKYDYIVKEDKDKLRIFRYYIDNKVYYYSTFLNKVWRNSDSIWSYLGNIFSIITYK